MIKDNFVSKKLFNALNFCQGNQRVVEFDHGGTYLVTNESILMNCDNQ